MLLHLEDVSDSTLQQCVALIDRLAGEGLDTRGQARPAARYLTWTGSSALPVSTAALIAAGASGQALSRAASAAVSADVCILHRTCALLFRLSSLCG